MVLVYTGANYALIEIITPLGHDECIVKLELFHPLEHCLRMSGAA